MIVREINWRSPYAAFSPLVGVPHAHLLNGGDLCDAAQWAIIVAFPALVLAHDQGDSRQFLPHLQSVVDKRLYQGEALPADIASVPFCTGLVGFMGYEALAGMEPSLDLPDSPYAFQDASFGVYDAAAIFSKTTCKAYIVGCGEEACDQLESALGGEEIGAAFAPEFSSITSNFTRRDYMGAVSNVVERILNGDFYQANISQRLTAQSSDPFSAYDLYRLIAGKSDAFFGAFLQYTEGVILSNSPERFFRLDREEAGRKRIVTEPIKGTRRRAADANEDASLAAALMNDPKDRAENIMIADLMRNDLSKFCKDGSICEDAICELMTLSHVHHLVSRLSGDLRDGLGIGDVFRGLFPSGSITGAPKIEAMKTIAEIEGSGRGPYCGAIGYIDDRGGADFSVSIRTMMADQETRRLSIPVGGGITQRSDARDEYEETLVKAVGAVGSTIDIVNNLS